LEKNNILEFYKKRVVRIIPTYLIFAIVYILLLTIFKSTPSITEILSILTGTEFWINGELLFWYISAIIVLYLLFPFFLKVINFGKNSDKKINLLILLGFLYLIILAISFSKLSYLLIFFSRIPIFIIGCFIGKMLKEEKEDIGLIWIITAGVIGIIAMFLADKISIQSGKWIGAGLVIIPACLIAGKIIEKIENNKTVNKIMIFLKFMGKYSLEIFLIHVVILKFDKYIKIMIYGNEKANGKIVEIRYLVYFIITLITAFVLNKIMDIVKKKLFMKK
jgi:peptidoglycan/LPS O-acetylase OafA/YrhL